MGKLEYCVSFLLLLPFASGFCANSQNPYELFGTKTLYEKVRGRLPSSGRRIPKGCLPVYVFGVIRHGARHPGNIVEEMQQLKALSEKINTTGRATLCRKDLQALQNWRIWSDEYSDRNLTEYGATEMAGIATRFRQFLPEIMGGGLPQQFRFPLMNESRNKRHRPIDFGNMFSKGTRFQSTESSRSIDSMHAFADELGVPKSKEGAFRVIPNRGNPMKDENCAKYVRDVDNHPSKEEEFNKFLAGPFGTRVTRRITRRLGLPKNSISSNLLLTMYGDGCSYQQWVEGRVAPWCKVFSRRDLKILEYAGDLEDYAERSFNTPIAYQWTCSEVKDIVGAIKEASIRSMTNASYTQATFRFAHTSNVAVPAANMGLYKRETPPTASNFETQKRRAFRMSKFGPSAANLVFVLYRCTADGNTTFKVQTYWNERLLRDYPACTTGSSSWKGLCDLPAWLDAYSQFVPGSENECNQESICAV